MVSTSPSTNSPHHGKASPKVIRAQSAGKIENEFENADAVVDAAQIARRTELQGVPAVQPPSLRAMSLTSLAGWEGWDILQRGISASGRG
jgi:hypothetical protein